MDKILKTRTKFYDRMNLLFLQEKISQTVLQLTGVSIKSQSIKKIENICQYVWETLWEKHVYICELQVLNDELLKTIIPHIIQQMKIKSKYLKDINSPLNLVDYPTNTSVENYDEY